MRRPENSMSHVYFFSGAFILEAHFVIHLQIFLPSGKYNGTFATQHDDSKPVFQERAFQGLKIHGNKTPTSSLLPLKPRCAHRGSLLFSPLRESKPVIWALREGRAPAAPGGSCAGCCRASALPPALPALGHGAGAGKLQLFSNEIPRVAVKSLLSLVHKMCWLDKALRNFKIMLLLKRYLREDFSPFKSRMWWQGPSPGEFRANVFFCFAPLICSRGAEAVGPCKARCANGTDVYRHTLCWPAPVGVSLMVKSFQKLLLFPKAVEAGPKHPPKPRI